MGNTEKVRGIAEELAKRRLKGCKRVFETDDEEQRQYERLLIAYDSDVEEYILKDFEERCKKEPACEMSLVVKAFRFGQSSLTKEEYAEWDRQMMVFDEAFLEEYHRMSPELVDKDIN